jgi:hypothetical protein
VISPRPTIIMRTLIPIFALATLASCSSQTDPAADFEVVASVAPSVARLGDQISVTVTATNISAKAQDILTNECLPAFAVLDSAGTHVGPSAEQFCTASAESIRLQPGERYSVTQPWAGDAIRLTSTAPVSLVRPGSYIIDGELRLGASVRTVPVTVRLVQ